MAGILVTRKVQAFSVCERGNVAIIFAAVVIPVIGIAAAAIDFGRAGKVREALQMAASAAAQAASARLDEDKTTVERQAAAMLKANLPEGMQDLPHEVRIANDRASVEVSLSASVPTTLMGLLGKREIVVEGAAQARRVMPVAATGSAPADPAVGEESRFGAVLQMLFGRGVPVASGAAGMRLPGFGSETRDAARSVDAMEVGEAARQIADQLRDIHLQGGHSAVGALPPAAAGDLERLMRDLQRQTR
ncbi:MAG: pilus assembly protein TadG-related protein [Hyphomicrobiaceae bacterium]|nr:pilus assembly protein TadG-related protein [Hyphomicrobiaceae bacterium]